MDFFGILFDMKNGKKMPYSKNYFDTLFAAKLEELGVKTITGTLPLTFTAKAGAADTWTIYGNDDNGTENLFDKDNAENRANIYPYQNVLRSGGNTTSVFVPCEPNTTYTICKQAGERFIAFWTTEYPAVSVSYYGEIADNTASSITITTGSNAEYVCAFVHHYQYDTTSLVDMLASIMIVKGSTAPDHYIPYQKGVGEQRQDGYYVPLTISQTGQTDKTFDIYIGDTPLTEGETVSKQSTGVDLELFEGENTISTTLYNKPEMTITYK